MIPFAAIETGVRERLGSAQTLASRMPLVLSAEALTAKPDSYFLSAMTRRVFQAGMKHSVINDRWPFFEEWFWGFEPEKLRLLSERQLERAMQEKRLIRHWGKLRTIPLNAAVMRTLSERHGGFGRYLAEWPDARIFELWRDLARHFERMGGDSAARFLRLAGRDTYLLTTDVVAALRALELTDGRTIRRDDHRRINDQFLAWQAETGYPLAHLSRILSLTVG